MLPTPSPQTLFSGERGADRGRGASPFASDGPKSFDLSRNEGDISLIREEEPPSKLHGPSLKNSIDMHVQYSKNTSVIP